MRKRQTPTENLLWDRLHHANSQYDLERDTWLEGQGFQVLRFWNHDITNNLEGVLQTISTTLRPK